MRKKTLRKLRRILAAAGAGLLIGSALGGFAAIGGHNPGIPPQTSGTPALPSFEPAEKQDYVGSLEQACAGPDAAAIKEGDPNTRLLRQLEDPVDERVYYSLGCGGGSALLE